MAGAPINPATKTVLITIIVSAVVSAGITYGVLSMTGQLKPKA